MDDSAQTELIKLATRIADKRAPGSGGDDAWLRSFRKAYRHLAASTGDKIGTSGVPIDDLLQSTEQELAGPQD